MIRIENGKYYIIAACVHSFIALYYVFICLSNYDFEWFKYDIADKLKSFLLFQLNDAERFDPILTWGLAGLNVVFLAIFLVLFRERGNDSEKTLHLKSIFWPVVIPFGLALFAYLAIDYSNAPVLAITGFYVVVTIALVDFRKIDLHW